MPPSSPPARRGRRRALLAVSVLALLTLVAIGLYRLLSDSDTSGSPASVRDPGAPGEPYPYATPVPPRTPTPLDGTYDRRLSAAQAGGRPVKCRRCAPYRREAGPATLLLDRGWFGVDHPAAGFRSLGHFLVEGDRITFFNDPNCPTDRGVYEWSMSGTELRLDLISDECPFDRLRGRYLTAEPWTKA